MNFGELNAFTFKATSERERFTINVSLVFCMSHRILYLISCIPLSYFLFFCTESFDCNNIPVCVYFIFVGYNGDCIRHPITIKMFPKLLTTCYFLNIIRPYQYSYWNLVSTVIIYRGGENVKKWWRLHPHEGIKVVHINVALLAWEQVFIKWVCLL